MMTHRLIISCGKAILTFDDNDIHKLENLADYCKTIGAYSSSGNPYELVISSPNEYAIQQLHSLAFELGLF